MAAEIFDILNRCALDRVWIDIKNKYFRHQKLWKLSR